MIRKAKVGDVAALVNLLCQNREDDSAEARSCILREFEACIGHNERSLYLAADEDGACLGYILVHWIPFPMIRGHEGYISDLRVLEGRRGGGLGSQLVSMVETEARERGCCRLILNNPKINESYQRAFYKKREFAERDNFANFVKAL